MGSFLVQCFTSKQSIQEGSDVVIFPIIPNSASNTCYSNSQWSFCSDPFFGKYKDYGEFEIDESTTNLNSLKNLRENLENNSEFSFDDVAMAHHSRKSFQFNNHRYMKGTLNFAVMLFHTYEWLRLEYPHQGYYSAFPTVHDRFAFKMKQCFESYTLGDKKGVERISELLYMNKVYDNVCDSYINAIKEFPDKVKEVFDKSGDVLHPLYIGELYESYAVQYEHRAVADMLDNLHIGIEPIRYASQDNMNKAGSKYSEMVEFVNKELQCEILGKYSE